MIPRAALTLEELLARIDLVAEALEGVAPRFVFVGGALGAIYPLRVGFTIRPTDDVDVVVDGVPQGDFHLLEARLRHAGFRNAASADAPRCRWLPPVPVPPPDFTVDIVPPFAGVEGVTNRWYPEGLLYAEERLLPSGRSIWALSPLYFVATKLEAHASRGTSLPTEENPDVEDVVTVLVGFDDLRTRIAQEDTGVCRFIRSMLVGLEPVLSEGISGLLPGDVRSQALGPLLVRWIASLPRA